VYLAKDIIPTKDFEILDASSYLDDFFKGTLTEESRKRIDLLLGT
jgi:hypothetical protein